MILKNVYSHGQFDNLLLNLQGSPMTQYKDMDDKLKALRKRLSNDHAKILYCLDDLGLICAYEVWLYIKFKSKRRRETEKVKENKQMCHLLFSSTIFCVIQWSN